MASVRTRNESAWLLPNDGTRTAKVGPVAIPNGRFGNRPHCIYRGFCLQGCKVNAKASPLISHIPDALARGGEVRTDAMVTRIGIDERTGRATGVHYVRGGLEHFQRARMVAVAGYSIETDRHGLPVARFSYSQGDNDRQLLGAAQQVMEDILHAAGADEVITIQRYAHLVGGARMATGEQHGVVRGDCRSFAVPNLYLTDGSVLPTQGSANPALTIMAVAARAAGLLAAGARGGAPA